MDFLIMKSKTSTLALMFLGLLLLTAGCQTLNQPRFRSEATVVKLPDSDAYQVSYQISEVVEGGVNVLASPRLVFRAGQPANIRIEGNGRLILGEAYIQSGQTDPLCLVKTRVLEKGRQIFHYSEVIKPAN